MIFLRNYFIVFALALSLLFLTKVFFLAFHWNQFSNREFGTLIYAIFWGFRFDLAMAAIIAWLVNLFNFNQRLLQHAMATLLSLLVLMQLGDILYFEDAARHVGYEITDIFHDFDSLLLTAVTQHPFFTISTLGLLPFLHHGFLRLARLLKTARPNLLYPVQFLLLLLISIFFVRGMAQPIPLTPWQASQIGDSELAVLALNGSYSMTFALFEPSGKLQPDIRINATDDEIRKSFDELYGDAHKKMSTSKALPNVVLFFLEGWSAAHMKPYGYPKTTTPFFDSLLPHALWPRAAIAGGRRTTEGIFTTLTSFQNPLGKTIANTQLQVHPYDSLIDIFNRAGYKSLFFQGTAKETSGTGAFAQKLGFQYSFGKNDVIERIYPTNSWGVHDPDLYAFVLKQIDKIESPFIIGINGATTHDISIPDKIPVLPLAENQQLNRRLNALHFADAALGEFVQTIQERYPNTLFVFFADHAGGGHKKMIHNYLIPLAFVGPGVIPTHIDHIVSQRDIAPTLVDLVFGDYRRIAPNFSGKSLVGDSRFFADYFHNGVLGWVENGEIVEFLPQQNKLRCFHLDKLEPIDEECGAHDPQYASHLRSFTHVSQKLLFAGKTREFHLYRNGQIPH